MNLETNKPVELKCNVAILAGGKGVRLLERSGDLPKPMVPVCGKPVLQHLIEMCKKYSFCHIALLVHHRHEMIRDYFGDGSDYGVSIKYVIESEQRGTSGALRDALPVLSERFLVLYADTFMDVDLQKLWISHVESKAAATLFLHPNDHPHDSDLVVLNNDKFVSTILAYPHKVGLEALNLVNAALYVLERMGLEDVTPIAGKADIAKDMFPRMLELQRLIYGYISPEYIKDMGTPQRLDRVERDFIDGIPDRLSNRNLRKAVFVDRDGTLIQDVGHLKSPDQIKFISGTSMALQCLNRKGILAVVITNQSVIARGDITLDQLNQIHSRIETILGAEGAFLDRLYFCPHHPDKGFPDEIPELKVKCLCRKPQPGLIEQACRDLNINKYESWMIGDTTTDIEAGRRAGVKTILVRTGFAGTDAKYAVRPDYIFSDLTDAVDWVVNGHTQMTRKIAEVAFTACHGKRLVLIGGLARSGKSFAAQVLKELMVPLGRKAHVVSLDGWLKPKPQRTEGSGVCDRYELTAATNEFVRIFHSKSREVLKEPIYERITGLAGNIIIEHSIGPDDIIIIEGVTALMIKELNILQSVLKIFMEITPSIRNERLFKDYQSRGQSFDHYSSSLAMREIDEVPVVLQSSKLADFIIK
jgi:D,D-heptose 1,7-bisphosphate phosphatase